MESEFLGLKLVEPVSFSTFILKFLIDLIVIVIITNVIYYKSSRNKPYMFTMLIFNITIFMVCTLLNNLTLSIGFAFGIFALFSVLRYRTTTIPIKEMTYLFVAISIAIINALVNDKVSIAELVFTNGVILIAAFVLDKFLLKNEQVKTIIFEKIELVKPENRSMLLDDLQSRTGLNINRIEVGKIDFLKDVAEIKIYYYSQPGQDYHSETNGYDG